MTVLLPFSLLHQVHIAQKSARHQSVLIFFLLVKDNICDVPSDHALVDCSSKRCLLSSSLLFLYPECVYFHDSCGGILVSFILSKCPSYFYLCLLMIVIKFSDIALFQHFLFLMTSFYRMFISLLRYFRWNEVNFFTVITFIVQFPAPCRNEINILVVGKLDLQII